MKAGYTIDKHSLFKSTRFIYLFNYSSLNEVVHFCFRKNMNSRYSNNEECVGVWNIKKK